MIPRISTGVYFCVTAISKDTTVARLGGGFSFSKGL